MSDLIVYYPHGIKGEFNISGKGWLDPSTYFDNTGSIFIGSGVSISQGCLIYTHDHYHYKNLKIDETVEKLGVKISDLVIEDDVYLGARCIILASCHKLGKGCVIGAGSIVTKDIPAYEIWAGNPAKFIKNVKDYE